MEIKKNRSADPMRNSTLYFLIGINTILLIIIGLFQYRNYSYNKKEREFDRNKFAFTNDDYSPVFTIRKFELKSPITSIQASPISIHRRTKKVSRKQIIQKQTKLSDVYSPMSSSNITINSSSNSSVSTTKSSLTSSFKEEKEQENTIEDETIIYNRSTVTTFPIYPGCEKFSNDKIASFKCMSEKMNTDIADLIETPSEMEDGKQRKFVLSFIIDKEGKITNVQSSNRFTVEEPFLNASIKALSLLNEKLSKKKGIIPPKNDAGNPSNMTFTLPFNFISEE